MKIALDFVNNEIKEKTKIELTKRHFKINEGSFGTLWVHNLGHIDYSKKNIGLNKNDSMQFYAILLEDLDYFEIWEEK